MAFRDFGSFKPYVPVAERRALAEKALRGAVKRGGVPAVAEPVRIEGTKIAHSFWGQGWCRHLEGFADFTNRLPRGRTYVRSGAVCHLAIETGRVEAKVMGSSLYDVSVSIARLPAASWEALRERCAGSIGSMLDLLQGRLSDKVMRVVADRETGLFPKPREMDFSCSCPDGARMCKHVAAVLYGVGSRLDQRPELLFVLRGVDAQELVAAGFVVPGGASPGGDADQLAESELSAIFGVELDLGAAAPSVEPVRKKAQRSGRRPLSR